MIINLSSYIESVTNPNGRFRTLERIYPKLDSNREPIMTVNTISADFEMVLDSDRYKMKCLMHPQEEVCDRLKEVSRFIQLVDNDYLCDYIYMEKEMLIFDNYDNPHYIDIILERIPKGKRLDVYIKEMCDEGVVIPSAEIIKQMARMAKWMLDSDFSHGKISSKTIWITPSTLKPVLTDYTLSSRDVSNEDIKALGTLAAALYTVGCEPRVNIYIGSTNANSRSETGSKFSAFVPALLDLIGEQGPDELRLLLSDIQSAGVRHIPAKQLYERLTDLAKTPLCAIKAVTDMIDHLSREKRRGGSFETPSLQEGLVKYRFVGEMHNMMMRAFDGEWWYYLDKNGSVAIKGDFIDATDFNEGLAVVETITGYGLIDIEGRFVIEPLYDDMECEYTGNIVIVTKDGNSGIYSRDGKPITGLIYDQILNVGDGLVTVKKNNLFGYIDTDGAVAIELKFDDAFGFRDGVARVRLKGHNYLIDTKGNEVVEIEQYHNR